MVTDKNNNELHVGDHVLYVSDAPKRFALRGEIVGFTPIGNARDGEELHLVDVRIKFFNKEPAKDSIVRIWSGQLEKCDEERTTFV
jgi:hypothetical protein